MLENNRCAASTFQVHCQPCSLPDNADAKADSDAFANRSATATATKNGAPVGAASTSIRNQPIAALKSLFQNSSMSALPSVSAFKS